MASLSEIRAAARALPHLAPGQHVNGTTRGDLIMLAQLCGMAPNLAHKANDTDLISIALVAGKDAEGGRRVAGRIAMRLDDSLLASPTAPRTAPEPAPRTEPTPDAPSMADLMRTIREMVKTEVREGALDPLQAALEAAIRDMTTALDGTPTLAAQAALAMVRESLADLAHKAAVDALKLMTPTRLEIVAPNHPEPINLGLVHKLTPTVIGMLTAGVNVYLHGPAGSGKTTVARKAAEAFGLQFYFAAKVESEYQLIGFKDAKGETVRTQFREAYEYGGVFLFDEMDGSSPSAVVALNAALANGICPFPDGVIQRHKDFLCIGAGNTKLTGATRQYAGRTQLDAASIDRFMFLEFGYDDELERALATDTAWCEYVQNVRRVIDERGLSHLVSPRATYDGIKLLRQGFDWDTVAGMAVYKGLDADTRRQIEAAL